MQEMYPVMYRKSANNALHPTQNAAHLRRVSLNVICKNNKNERNNGVSKEIMGSALACPPLIVVITTYIGIVIIMTFIAVL